MKRGKFDLAHEGTLFLDEIGDMSLRAQSKTLRILQERKFERVGGTKTIHVDVRVIAATNKDLEAEIDKAAFREDLYFRLNVIPIRVPPLRERVEDIPALIEEFTEEFSLDTNQPPKRFSENAIRLLMRYHWPGNVRELKNLVERLVIMTASDEIRAADIPPPFNETDVSIDDMEVSLMGFDTYREARVQFEKSFIARKLREYKGNVSQTAEAIGLERSNLHKKIKAYGLDKGR